MFYIYPPYLLDLVILIDSGFGADFDPLLLFFFSIKYSLGARDTQVHADPVDSSMTTQDK